MAIFSCLILQTFKKKRGKSDSIVTMMLGEEYKLRHGKKKKLDASSP